MDPTENPTAPAEPAGDSSSVENRESKTEDSTHTGNGRIARLPEIIRDQVNQMIADGVPYKDILQSIGEHAKGITVGNITTWKTHGGHDRWLQHRDTKAVLNITRGEAADLATQKSAAPLQEAGRSLASAQLYELLRVFDTSALRSALSDKPELYLRLVTCVSRLSEAEASCAHRQVQQALAQLKLEQAKAIDTAIDPKRMYTGEQMLEILRHIKIL